MWNIRITYASANRWANDLIRQVSDSYVLLGPPASPIDLIVLGGATHEEDVLGGFHLDRASQPYKAWAARTRVIDAETVRARLEDEVEEYYQLPGRDELLEAKWFSEMAKTPVAVYALETWGGSVEYEWAWLFSPEGERVLVYVSRVRQWEETARTWYLGRRTVQRVSYEPVIVTVTENEVTERPEGSGLSLFGEVLRHLGDSKATGDFVPHSRGFDWERYRVSPDARDVD